VCQALEAWMQATAEQATGLVDCDPGDCAAPQGLKPLVFSAVDGRVEGLPLRKTKIDVDKLRRPVFPAGF